MYGRDIDKLVRAGDGWIFQNRVFHPIHGDLPGDFKEQLVDAAE